MRKHQHKTNPRVTAIFEELENLLEFCKDYGYVYDESTLGDFKTTVWQQYSKYRNGKHARNVWDTVPR